MPYKNKEFRLEFMRNIVRKRREQNRQFVRDYLASHPCVDCGESDPVVLDFHHRNPKDKSKAVSRLVVSSTLSVIKKEIEKCDILCANDHRRRHSMINRNPNPRPQQPSY